MEDAPLVGQAQLLGLHFAVAALGVRDPVEHAGSVEVLDLDRDCADCLHDPTQPETTDNEPGPKPMSTSRSGAHQDTPTTRTRGTIHP